MGFDSCRLCKGIELIGDNSATCNVCDGMRKQMEISDDSYPFSKENVRMFVDFCSNSGGFDAC
jgi:hypothetical protein